MKDNTSGLNSVSGLNNLGNTCFFNSVLQNLAQTPYLEHALRENLKSINASFLVKHNEEYDSELTDYDEEQDIKDKAAAKPVRNVTQAPDYIKDDSSDSSPPPSNRNKLSNAVTTNKDRQHRSIRLTELQLTLSESPGIVTRHFYEVLKNMKSATSSVVNPDTFFSSICKKVPTFKGFQQQDSHELLRNLLDVVRTEELKRRQSAILQTLKVDKNIKTLDDLTKKKIKRYGRLASFTFIEKVFGGHLLSSVVCSECQNCAQRVEPFLDLSLPIVDAQTDRLSGGIASIKSQLRSVKSGKKSGSKAETPESFKKGGSDDEAGKSKMLSKHQEKKLKKMTKKASKGKGKGRKKDDDDEEEDDTKNKPENDKPDKKESKNDEMVDPQVDAITDSVADINLNTSNEKSASAEPEPVDDQEQSEVEDESDHEIRSQGGIDKKFKLEAQKSLKPEQQNEPGTLAYFLTRFTSKEQLSDKIVCENCSREHRLKKAYTSASKQYLICELPAILTIHLKRFQQHGMRLEKSNKFVDFPLKLDMGPYTSKMCVNKSSSKSPVYHLYGLVEHSGRLTSGHYTACVRATKRDAGEDQRNEHVDRFLNQHRLCHLKKSFMQWSQELPISNTSNGASSSSQEDVNLNEQKWYYISDSQVREVSVEKVLKSQAYLLFYERVQ